MSYFKTSSYFFSSAFIHSAEVIYHRVHGYEWEISADYIPNMEYEHLSVLPFAIFLMSSMTGAEGYGEEDKREKPPLINI